MNELKIEGKYKQLKLYGNRKVSGIVNKIKFFRGMGVDDYKSKIDLNILLR